MKDKEKFGLLIGVAWTILLLCSILILVSGPVLTRILSIVVICLSLATGMLMPNPISFVALFVGLGIVLLPSAWTGIFLVAVSLGGMISNLVVWLKRKPRTA